MTARFVILSDSEESHAHSISAMVSSLAVTRNDRNLRSCVSTAAPPRQSKQRYYHTLPYDKVLLFVVVLPFSRKVFFEILFGLTARAARTFPPF